MQIGRKLNHLSYRQQEMPKRKHYSSLIQRDKPKSAMQQLKEDALNKERKLDIEVLRSIQYITPWTIEKSFIELTEKDKGR